MGAGRKTQTFTLAEKSVQDKYEAHWSTVNNCSIARNLKKSELGGVIFGCKNNTMHECLSRKLFGLPSPHFSYVKNIGPGLPLFLFNYTEKMLHGIFEAAGDGRLRIEPNAWTGNELNHTPFAAQVRIRTRVQCQPLSEKQFGPIIKDNYCDERHFYFELDRTQTEKLVSLFMSFKMTASTSSSQNVVNREPKLKALAVSNGGKRGDGIAPKALNVEYPGQDTSQDAPSLELARLMVGRILDDEEEEEIKRKGVGRSYLGGMGTSCPPRWSSLFKSPSTSDAEKKSSDMNSAAPELPLPSGSGHAAWGWVSPRFDHSVDGAVNSSKASFGKPEKNQGHLGLRQNDGALNSFNPAVGSTCAPRTNSTAGNSEADIEKTIIVRELNPSYDMGMDYSSEDLDGESHPLELAANVVAREAVEKATYGFQSQIGTNYNLVNLFTQERENLLETESSHIYSVVGKLLGEVGELRLSRLEQEKKISSLELDVIKSRLEIQLLKDKWKKLECQSSKTTGSLEEEPKSTNDPLQSLGSSIFVVGGHDGSEWLKSTECYCPSLDCTEPRCPIRFILPHSSATKLKDEIFVLGGGSNQLWHDEVESYNTLSNKWTSFPPLRQKRGNLASVSFNDKIYAIGGGNGVECLSEVDMFLMDLGTWIPSSSMLQKRFSHGAAEINGAIYAVGGYDGKGYLSSAERFDPRERSWTKLESMPTNRGCHSLVVLNGKLFALGGYDGNIFVSTVDIFDPRKGSWMPGDPMKNCLAYSTATAIGGGIYALGSMTGDREFVSTVEHYKEGHGWQITNLKGIGKRLYNHFKFELN